MPLPLRGKLPLLLLALLRVMNQRVLTDMGSLDETAGSTYETEMGSRSRYASGRGASCFVGSETPSFALAATSYGSGSTDETLSGL